VSVLYYMGGGRLGASGGANAAGVAHAAGAPKGRPHVRSGSLVSRPASGLEPAAESVLIGVDEPSAAAGAAAFALSPPVPVRKPLSVRSAPRT
jgi:hypothetical protein